MSFEKCKTILLVRIHIGFANNISDGIAKVYFNVNADNKIIILNKFISSCYKAGGDKKINKKYDVKEFQRIYEEKKIDTYSDSYENITKDS